MLAAFGDDLAELAAACAQLISDASDEITEGVVDKYYGGRIETNAFKVADAALAGRSGDALALLRDEGLIYSLVGRGTFASPGHRQLGVRITQSINEPYVGGRPSVLKVLEQGLVEAPA